MAINFKDLHSKKIVLENMQKMNSFGIRLTGNTGHESFVKWLKSEVKAMGCNTYSTPYKFKRWEAKDVKLTINETDISVSSPFPYSGITDINGVNGKLYEVSNNIFGFMRASGNIAVVHIKNLHKLSSKVAFNKRNSIPSDLTIEPSYRGPVSTAFVKTLLYSQIKNSKTKAVICVWEDMSDAMVEGHYLNFILKYLKVPIIWVNETQGQKVLQACKTHETANVRLLPI